MKKNILFGDQKVIFALEERKTNFLDICKTIHINMYISKSSWDHFNNYLINKLAKIYKLRKTMCETGPPLKIFSLHHIFETNYRELTCYDS